MVFPEEFPLRFNHSPVVILSSPKFRAEEVDLVTFCFFAEVDFYA
jgi:hypothetical protein